MESPEYPQKGGLHIIVRGPENPVVDIIAVHGLAANPAYTWIKKIPNNTNVSNGIGRLNAKGDREVMWLKHLLPGVVANARILKYNYDSRWLANAPKENLRSLGDRLVRMVHLKRKEEGCFQRPLIFIGHSFGGIVIEEALLHAYRTEEHRSIALNTCGVVFLGTPFRGSAASSWGVTIANCAAVLGLGSESRLLETLKEDSERLELLVNEFTIMAKLVGMKLVCFYEVYETKLGSFGVGFQALVVEKRSAIIDGYHPISLQAEHSQMNKFGSSEDESFKLVSSEIQNLGDWVPDFVYTAGITRSRQKYIIIPYPQNENFTPREVPYKRLSTLMKRPEDKQVRIAIRGLGGIGKIQIALKLAYDSKPTRSVFWVHGSTQENYMTDYMDIARKVRLIVAEQPQTDSEVCNAVKEWLDSDDSGEWILIVDNADDLTAALLDCFLTTLPVLRGTILFATRNANIVHEKLVSRQSEINLETMTEAESMATFLTISGLEGHGQLDKIRTLLDTLGHLPLAVAQSAAYIEQTKISVDIYTNRLQASDEMQSKLLNAPLTTYEIHHDIPRSVMNTWEVSFTHIETAYPASGMLLQIMSLLDFQGIPRCLLEAPTICSRLGLEDEIEFENALRPLVSFSLVKTIVEPMSQQIHYSIHRLVSLSTRVRMGSTNELVSFTLDLLGNEFPKPSLVNLRSCEMYFPHVATILSHTASHRTLLPGRIALQYRIAKFHLLASHLEKAAELFAVCYDYHAQTRGDGQEATLDIIYHMASVFDAQGRYQEALQLYERALAGKEKVLGDDHPDTLSTVYAMASVFLSQGRYQEAFQLYERALAANKKALGNDHPSTLSTVNARASVFDEQGRDEEALQLYERTLAGMEKALGKDHPSTLSTVDPLASIIDYQGRYEEALQLYERALAGKVEALGNDHPSTLSTVNAMASVFQSQGRYQEALQLYERALAGNEKAHGNDHPSTLSTVYAIASVFDYQGRYEEALQWYERSLAGREKALGKDHPHTLRTADDIAMCIKRRDKPDDGLSLFRRGRKGYKKVYSKVRRQND